MRPLRYSINITLDGCCDHRAMLPDEELHRHAAGSLGRGFSRFCRAATTPLLPSRSYLPSHPVQGGRMNSPLYRHFFDRLPESNAGFTQRVDYFANDLCSPPSSCGNCGQVCSVRFQIGIGSPVRAPVRTSFVRSSSGPTEAFGPGIPGNNPGGRFGSTRKVGVGEEHTRLRCS